MFCLWSWDFCGFVKGCVREGGKQYGTDTHKYPVSVQKEWFTVVLISVLKSPWKPPTATNISKNRNQKKPLNIFEKMQHFLKKKTQIWNVPLSCRSWDSSGSSTLPNFGGLLRRPAALTAWIDPSFQTLLIRPRASLLFTSCFKQALLQERTPRREINICICALSPSTFQLCRNEHWLLLPATRLEAKQAIF